MAKTKEEREAQMRVFAVAYTTPESPTHENATQSYLACDPTVDTATASTQGSRYLKMKFVQDEIERIQAEATWGNGLPLDEFIRRALKREAEFAKSASDDPKYATAAAKYMEMAGKAAGHFITKIEDMTPPDRRGLISGADLLAMIAQKVDTMREISQPNPLPQLPPAQEPVDADFTIEETP